ncbi:MAG: hypothetical protein ABIN04_16085 [Ginsengibacter sp.]
MISITAQNEFFNALLVMVNTGANNPNIDTFYENMIAEFQTNKIGLNDDEQNKLFAKLGMRFNKFSGIRIVGHQLEKFKRDKIILKPYPNIIELIEREQKKVREVTNDPLDFIDPAPTNSKDENNTGDQSSFELLSNVLTTDCFTTLKNHRFINTDTKKTDFAKIFQNKEIITKIDWKGGLRELSRFVFLLHNDYEKRKNKAVCKNFPKLDVIMSKCFTHNGRDIDPKQYDNHELSNESRYGFLLKAIAHLQDPKKTT